MNADEPIEPRGRIDAAIDAHWWPSFWHGDRGFFTHYCGTCQLRYTREAFKSHLRDELIKAMGGDD